MKRINIIGAPGAGKTYLARELAKKHNLPIVHMDFLAHTDRYNPLFDKPAFNAKILSECKKDRWIMEGVYKSTLGMRIPRADLTIHLDYPRRIYIYRVLKRRVQYRDKRREEMPENWQEKINWDFFKYVLKFNKLQKPAIETELAKYKNAKIEIVRNPKELKKLISVIGKGSVV